MGVLMVIDRTERERERERVLASPCNRLPFANGIRRLLNDIRLNFDLKPSLSPGLGLRRWPALDKNVKHRHDVGLRTLWRENKFLSTRFLAILTSFWTHIDYFKFLASHLTVFSYLSLTHWDGSSISLSRQSSSAISLYCIFKNTNRKIPLYCILSSYYHKK